MKIWILWSYDDGSVLETKPRNGWNFLKKLIFPIPPSLPLLILVIIFYSYEATTLEFKKLLYSIRYSDKWLNWTPYLNNNLARFYSTFFYTNIIRASFASRLQIYQRSSYTKLICRSLQFCQLWIQWCYPKPKYWK